MTDTASPSDLQALRDQKARMEYEAAHRARKLSVDEEKEKLRNWIDFHGEVPCA